MSLVCANSNEDDMLLLELILQLLKVTGKLDHLTMVFFRLLLKIRKLMNFLTRQKKKIIFATFDEYAYEKADVVIVDINPDVQKQNNDDNVLVDYDVSLSFKNGIAAIANRYRKLPSFN